MNEMDKIKNFCSLLYIITEQVFYLFENEYIVNSRVILLI
jgi:hypothetical protein